jgi:hypothetical protein
VTSSILSSRAKKIVRAADDLRSRGTLCLPPTNNPRSLHAPNDRLRRSLGLVGMTVLGWLLVVVIGGGLALGAESLSIQLAHDTLREIETAQLLQKVVSLYDLKKYTYTRDLIIDQRAINHAFPVLTLNSRFADSPDELLSSFIHEQLHWYLREHHTQTEDGVTQLRRFYPRVPVGGSEGADSVHSTYGHLIDCYLEIQADRQLMGEERTMAVIRDKGHYTWIYKTDLDDEARIATIVQNERLEIK